MTKKIIALLAMMVMALTGCDNSQLNKPSSNTAVSDPFVEDISNTPNMILNRVNFKVGLDETKAVMNNNTLQIPLKLNGDEGCEKVGIKVFIDGILQEFSSDNSENYSFNNILSVKTDDIPYSLKIKAKFDENIETHTISAVSVYNPNFVPQPGLSLGNNHKGAAGGFRVLPITDSQLDFSDGKIVLKASSPTPITNEQMEKYNLKGENSEAFLLVQNEDRNTYALNENGSSVSLQYVVGTQTAGSEKYRVSFYKNHELVHFNGDYSYLDVSLEGGKISITDIKIADVKDGDFLYCIAVPTASYNEFAYPKKTDTVVVTKGE